MENRWHARLRSHPLYRLGSIALSAILVRGKSQGWGRDCPRVSVDAPVATRRPSTVGQREERSLADRLWKHNERFSPVIGHTGIRREWRLARGGKKRYRRFSARRVLSPPRVANVSQREACAATAVCAPWSPVSMVGSPVKVNDASRPPASTHTQLLWQGWISVIREDRYRQPGDFWIDQRYRALPGWRLGGQLT